VPLYSHLKAKDIYHLLSYENLLNKKTKRNKKYRENKPNPWKIHETNLKKVDTILNMRRKNKLKTKLLRKFIQIRT